MTDEEKYAYYIDLQSFLESQTGQILISQLEDQINLIELEIAGFLNKINTPEDYDKGKEDFLLKKNKLKAFKEVKGNYLDPEAIKKQTISIKKLLQLN